MESASFLVDVRPLLEDLGATILIDADVRLPDVVLGTETFAPSREARLVAHVTNTGAGIVASGSVVAEFRATCSRCLREFPLEITTTVDGFYVPHGSEHELPEEQEFGFITEGSVDLMDQVLASLVLEMPFAPLHAEDCPGICVRCGQDLVDGACGCEPDHSDSPFAGLKDLLRSAEDA